MKLKFYSKYTKPFALFLLLCFFGLVSYGQKTLSGTVLDDQGESLIGATVQVKGGTTGTVTDFDGAFSLNVDDSAEVLVFSYTGYLTQEVNIGSQTKFDIVLGTNVEQLNEVVVLGYGRQQKSVVTGAISSINVDEIASTSGGQLESAIQGRTAGVTILPTSGSPGAGFKVRVRGAGSNGNANPLYVVDGMRTKDISFLSPSEIESLEVLKDAATAAIYGAEGANGVVIVTTKSGAKESGVTYDLQYGIQNYNGNLEMMNAQQHAQYLVDAGVAGRTPADVTSSTNWIDEVFESAPLQRHTLSFSGGDSDMSYFLQGSLFDQEGIVVGDNDQFKRYSLRANINNKVNNWLRVGANVNYNNNSRIGISEDNEFGGVLNGALLMDPATPVTYGANLPAFVKESIDNGNSLPQDADGNYYGLSQLVQGEIVNPIAAANLINGRGTKQNRMFGSFFGEVTLMDGLTVTSRFGVDNNWGEFHSWSPAYWFSSENLNNLSTVSHNFFKSSGYQWENFLNFNKDVGLSSFDVVLGTSAYKTSSSFTSAGGNGLIRESDIFGHLGSVQPGNEFTSATGGAAETALLSTFGRLTYDYADKYLASVTVRRDGSSLLADGQQWGIFPSVSLGWIVSRESFFPTSSALNFMKVRASWGQNGSLSNLQQGAWRSAIGFGSSYPDALENQLIAASPTILSNPELTWETSEQIDIGIDLGFFDDRLSLTADYFDKQTQDLLIQGVIPRLVGNLAPTVNLGDVTNKGVELELGYKNKAGELSYNIFANVTKMSNEVTRLDDNLNFAPGATVGVGWTATAFEEGLPAWYFRGYETDGILETQADAQAYAEQLGLVGDDGTLAEGVYAGAPRIVDVNGDGTISTADHTMIGSPHPDLIYGLRLGLDYKNFDFAFFLQGVSGNDILMGYNRADRAGSNKPAFFADEPFSPTAGNPYVFNGDYMIFDGSYARVKQVQLGYNFSESQLNFTRGGRLYVSLEDIATFTGYKGLDPEAGSTNDNSLGIDRGVYPIPAKILFGLSISL